MKKSGKIIKVVSPLSQVGLIMKKPETLLVVVENIYLDSPLCYRAQCMHFSSPIRFGCQQQPGSLQGVASPIRTTASSRMESRSARDRCLTSRAKQRSTKSTPQR